MRYLKRLIAALPLPAGSVWSRAREDGCDAYLQQDYVSAMRLLRPLATKGDAVPQATLGAMYSEGRGVPKDDQQAAAWFRKAAEQGHSTAQHNLGVVYREGLGVPKDDQQAYFWWLLASDGGDAKGIKYRDSIESRLTPQQRAAAQADARIWKPKSAR